MKRLRHVHYCRLCALRGKMRPLTSPKSIAKGYGAKCWKEMQTIQKHMMDDVPFVEWGNHLVQGRMIR